MKKGFLLVIVLFLLSNISLAQDSLSKKQVRKQKSNFLLTERHWSVELPIWIPGFAGTFAYGGVEIEGEDGVDPVHPIEPPPGGDFGKILSRLFQSDWYLKFFFLTKVAYENDKVLFQFDAISGSVGNSVKFKLNNKDIVKADFRTVNFRLIGGYKLFETISKNNTFKYELFGYVGGRVHFHSLSSQLNGDGISLEITPAWWEPVIGIQNQFTFKRWFLVFQGDYGGLFFNSKYSNQISMYSYFRTGKITSVKLGWNHLQLNHVGTFLREDYKIKATFSGPSIGIAFHF